MALQILVFVKQQSVAFRKPGRGNSVVIEMKLIPDVFISNVQTNKKDYETS